MRAPREQYEKYAPKNSFIHVDDFDSPAKLAQFLIILDKNDDLYNSYFQWKGTGKITNTTVKLFCEMCTRLSNDSIMSTPSWFEDDGENLTLAQMDHGEMLTRALPLGKFRFIQKKNSYLFIRGINANTITFYLLYMYIVVVKFSFNFE